MSECGGREDACQRVSKADGDNRVQSQSIENVLKYADLGMDSEEVPKCLLRSSAIVIMQKALQETLVPIWLRKERAAQREFPLPYHKLSELGTTLKSNFGM